MNKSDLKNGMIIVIRDNLKLIIKNNKIHRYKQGNAILSKLICCNLEDYLEEYNDNLEHKESFSDDIMKIYDINGNLIWERKEIDWSKIPVNTKIWVNDFKDNNWIPRHFAKYENGMVFAYDYGRTSWSCGDESPLGWDYAKLAEEPKEKPHITWDYIMAKFEKLCKEQNCDCTYCDYEEYTSINDCKIEWIKDNFDKVVQEYYSEN